MNHRKIISHAELMVACGDLQEVKRHGYVTTGSGNFENVIRAGILK